VSHVEKPVAVRLLPRVIRIAGAQIANTAEIDSATNMQRNDRRSDESSELSEITRRAGIQPARRPQTPEQAAKPLNLRRLLLFNGCSGKGRIARCSPNVSRRLATFVAIFQEVTR
jgi:hypothetical protein